MAAKSTEDGITDQKNIEYGHNIHKDRVIGHGSDVDVEARPEEAAQSSAMPEPPYSVMEHRQKVAIILTVSFMALVSPLSGAVYYPALDQISEELDITNSQTNVSIVTYLIFQAIAPSFIGSFSDNHGRRPAYMICYIVYLGANIGLALQKSYPALLILRMMQSAGSSGTVALAGAVVADLCTRAERGRYMVYAMMAAMLGPAIGPVIGGLLAQFLGWRWIFWFLAILAGVLLLVTIFVLPETCRSVVGNGSVPPPRWNRSVLTIVNQRRLKEQGPREAIQSTPDKPRKRPNPFTSVRIVLERESGTVLLFAGLIQMGYLLCLSTLSTQLASKFGYSPVIVGLCYLPIGAGSYCSRYVAGASLDWNFRRYAAKAGYKININQQQDLSTIDVEKARLEVNLPLMYTGVAAIITYGWVMDYSKIVGIEIALFVLGTTLSSSNSCLAIFVQDLHKDTPASASAANNLVRCLFGAAATGFGLPLINAIGIGWTGVFVGFLWLAASPLLWLVHWKGFEWRKAEITKRKQREAKPE